MKNIIFRKLYLSLIVLVVGFSKCSVLSAEVSVETMVENSINTLSSVNNIASLIDKQERLSQLANEYPNTKANATLIFKNPKNSIDLLTWIEGYNATIINLEAKIPVDDLTYTMFYNDLESLQGDIKEKIEHVKNNHKKAISNIIAENERKYSISNFFEKEKLAITNAINRHKKLLEKPVKYIKVEIVANYDELVNIRGGDDVALLLLLEDRSEQSATNLVTPKRPLIIKETPYQSLRTGDTGKASNKLNYKDQLTPDYNVTSFEVGESLLASKPVVPSICGGSAAPEFNCPGDKYWLPPASDTEMTAYIEVYGGESPWMQGYFYSTFEWSTVLDPTTNMRQNTMAYKAINTSHCNPEITGDLTAPCGGSTPEQDVTYVPDSTYEHEGTVENFACSITRTGTHADRSFNCLTPSYALSTLPDAYLDTTLLDSSNVMSATIGSLTPENILEGGDYYTYVEFWSYGNENFTGRRATVGGQIGTEYPLPVPAPLRVFAVDSTRLDDDILIPIP